MNYFIEKNTKACEVAEGERLMVPALLWLRMVRDIRARGMGVRESGAFLLGHRDGGIATVRKYIPYDVLDPHALDTGIVHIRSVGFKALWKRCRELGMEVLADVHTHGNAHPRQSDVDRDNPLITEAGHMALILPLFAGTLGWRFRNVAIYEYVGDYKWRDWSGPTRRQRIRFCMW